VPYAILHSEAPADFRSAIRETKLRLREQLGDYEAAFARAKEEINLSVDRVVRELSRGEVAWPTLNFEQLIAGSVSEDERDAIRDRGCVVIRGTFPRETAKSWDDELAEYLVSNHFFERYRYIDDGIFDGLSANKPSIFPIYWSRPQVLARQHPNMMIVRRFLNSLWRAYSEGIVWFDPTQDTGYPDRIRRREPGTNSTGLSPHVDSGSVERWLLKEYQLVFRHVFANRWDLYDPWDAAWRTEVAEYPSTVMCSAFRSFQGWTALSDMAPSEGVLSVVPIAKAMGYVLLRALQDDVPEDELCGAANGQALPITETWHSPLLRAKATIPAVEPGDTVWWHPDLIHAVEPVTNQKGWANVMYIPATPLCLRNATYAELCGRAFRDGRSPGDFAQEDYEVDWEGRATESDLNSTGRKQLGFDPW
jgi:hypothetical protein